MLDLYNCRWRWKFRCPLKWEALAPTADPSVRTCATCAKEVHEVRSRDDLAAHVRAGHCVSLDVSMWQEHCGMGSVITITLEDLDSQANQLTPPANAEFIWVAPERRAAVRERLLFFEGVELMRRAERMLTGRILPDLETLGRASAELLHAEAEYLFECLIDAGRTQRPPTPYWDLLRDAAVRMGLGNQAEKVQAERERRLDRSRDAR